MRFTVLSTAWDHSEDSPKDAQMGTSTPQACILDIAPHSFRMSAGFRTNRRQQERFTTRIRNVIREYPWGLGVTKEFLANADDAGSEHFAVIFDKRQHTTVGLHLRNVTIVCLPSRAF